MSRGGTRILAIRLRMIGDLILTTPALAALRRGFPRGRIELLVAEEYRELVEENPALDEIIPFRRGEGFRLIRELRRRRYEIVVDFHSIPRTAWLAWLTGAPCRIGFAYPDRSWLYTHALPPPRQFSRHSVETLASLLRPLGIFRHPGRVLMRSRAGESGAASLRRELGLLPGKYACLHAVPSNRFKRWPAPSYAALARGLTARGLTPLLLGTAADGVFLDEIRACSGLDLPSAAGRSGLAETRELIRHCALFVGPDSGPAHLAATTNVPLVVLYGPTPPGTFAPWRPGVLTVEGEAPCRPCRQKQCIPGDFRCMEIPLDRVRTAVDRALAVNPGPPVLPGGIEGDPWRENERRKETGALPCGSESIPT